MADKKIRLATDEDCGNLLAIYGSFVQHTSISFEYEVPSEGEFVQRIHRVLEKLPWLVCEMDGEIVGYAYASPHKERAAYQWSVDTSIYIHPAYQRKHIATALYWALFELLRLQGYYNAYAGVALPNVKSKSFHESFGFAPVGVFHHVGYKLGEWHDVREYECTLLKLPEKPVAPKPIGEVVGTKEFHGILNDAAAMIQP